MIKRSADHRVDNSNPPALGKRYFIGLGRAMVSLGPISPKAYCPYRCQFCYVLGPFPKYSEAPPDEITEWLRLRRSEFHIVYVSGDTDSFAPPRTSLGLDLLEQLLDLRVDVLFTTRAVFADADEDRLYRLALEYRRRDLLLVGCISISQLNHPALEPRPIPSPQARVEFLNRMKENGVVTALTIRPFIPSVSAEEYKEIADLANQGADIILGGDLFVDSAGMVRSSIDRAVEGPSLPRDAPRQRLDFSLADDEWEVIDHPAAVQAVRDACMRAGKPFFMRSNSGIDWLRARREAFLRR